MNTLIITMAIVSIISLSVWVMIAMSSRNQWRRQYREIKRNTIYQTSTPPAKPKVPRYGCGTIKGNAMAYYYDSLIPCIIDIRFEVRKEYEDKYEIRVIGITSITPDTEKELEIKDYNEMANSIDNQYVSEIILIDKKDCQLQIEVPDITINEEQLGKLLNNNELEINNTKIKLEEEYDYEEIFTIVTKYMI